MMATCNLPLSTISPTERRNDLHLTTAGMGHMYQQRALPIWPPTDLKSQRRSLPSGVTAPPNNLWKDDLCKVSTTARDYVIKFNNNKFMFKKAPSLMNVNYTIDTINKLTSRPWSKPLTMGNQLSETQDKYRGVPVPDALITKQLLQLPTLIDGILNDHHNNGHTERMKPTTVNTSLKGKRFTAQEQSVFDRNQLYMTTSNWYHRTASDREMRGYPRKDNATYWQCENYTKAWGFGTNENPLPSSKRANTSSDPMIDRLTFRTPTATPKSLKSVRLVSNSLQTQYLDSYQDMTEDERKELFKPLVEPAIIRTEKDTSFLKTVPNMYKGFNTTYGSYPNNQQIQ